MTRGDTFRPPGKSRIGNALFAAAVAACLGYAFWQRAPGLDPPSLWLDDQWVACLTKRPLLDLLSANAPSPIGFLFLEKVFAEIWPGQSWPLQLLPFASSLLLLPLLAWVGRKIFEAKGLALLVVVLATVSPPLLEYSVRVKQYACEAFAVAGVLGLFAVCCHDRGLRPYLKLCASAMVSFVISYASIAFSLVCVHLALFIPAGTQPRWKPAKSLAFAALGTDALIGIFAWSAMGGKRSPAMLGYWQDFFAPLNSVSSFLAFLATNGKAVLVGGFSLQEGWIACLVLAGLLSLLVQRRTLYVGLAIAGGYGCMVAASALQLYPLGGGRTDIFSYPLAMVAMAGLLHPLRRVRSKVSIDGALAACLSLLLLLTLHSARAAYPGTQDAALVRRLGAIAQPFHGLLIYPHANWAVGLYGPWTPRLKKTDYYAHSFEVHPDRERTLVLPGGSDGIPYTAFPQTLLPSLDAFLLQGHPTIHFILLYYRQDILQMLQTIFLRRGYSLVHSFEVEGGLLLTYGRQ